MVFRDGCCVIVVAWVALMQVQPQSVGLMDHRLSNRLILWKSLFAS